MPTRVELSAIARQLRRAPTKLAPIEVAERVQHTVARLEQLLVVFPLPSEADALYAEAKRLLESISPKP